MPRDKHTARPSSSAASSSLSDEPPEVTLLRTRVVCNNVAPQNAGNFAAPETFSSVGIDQRWTPERFAQELKISVVERSADTLKLYLGGINVALVNALRRILIAEVPTMAIGKVIFASNTSVLQDEVMAHRLGLVPIYADPRAFVFVADESRDISNLQEDDTLVFKLAARCVPVSLLPSGAPLPPGARVTDGILSAEVYSSQLQWVPVGSQAERFAADPPRPVYGDILLAKLKPGQQIDIECRVHKGIGQDHAKWSPVATASYQMLPDVKLLQPFTGSEAQQLVSLCPKKVFDIEDMGSKAVVSRPLDCSLCRECIRPPGWEQRVQLSRVKDEFLFTIESTGILSPEELFKEALKVLMEKCATVAVVLQGGAGE